MLELLNRIFRIPKMFFGAVMSNPIGIFISTLLGKWYLLVMLSAVVVAYWVLKGLEQAGILSAFQNTLIDALHTSKSIAQYCTPLITDLKAMWNCISNPPAYQPNADETSLQKTVDSILDIMSSTTNTNNTAPTNIYVPDNTPRNPYE